MPTVMQLHSEQCVMRKTTSGTKMFKVLITGIVVTLKVKKLWSHISGSLQQESPYVTAGIVIAHIPELQQDYPMARTVRKELATPNVNVYSGQSGEPCSEVEGILNYDRKLYIPGTLRADLLERNHDDCLAGYFGVQKTLELLSRKYYWPKMRADIEKYLQGYDICMSSKAQRHKRYSSMEALFVPTYK